MENINTEKNDFMMFLFDYSPLMPWFCYFGYLFFPSYKIFNGEGRRYVERLIKRVLNPFRYPIDFISTWTIT